MYFPKLSRSCAAAIIFMTAVGCSNENASSDSLSDSVTATVADTTAVAAGHDDNRHWEPDVASQNELYSTINGKAFETSIDNSRDDNLISQGAALILLDAGTISKDDFEDQEYEDEYGVASERTIVHLRNITIGRSTFDHLDATINNNLSHDLVLGRSISEQLSL
jgi:hypothetical protein